MKVRVIGGIIICLFLVLLYMAMLYKMPSVTLEIKRVSYPEFRQEVSIKYGLVMLILCVILSIVMVASVFAFRVSEEVGEKK